jgi:hypothetical protein
VGCWLEAKASYAPFLADGCRSDFATLPLELLQEQPDVVLLLDGALVAWSLAMDEHGGYEDLRGSSHRSVIPYVHGPTYLSADLSSTLVKRCLPGPFMMRPEARQVALRWLKPYTTSRTLMARSR